MSAPEIENSSMRWSCKNNAICSPRGAASESAAAEPRFTQAAVWSLRSRRACSRKCGTLCHPGLVRTLCRNPPPAAGAPSRVPRFSCLSGATRMPNFFRFTKCPHLQRMKNGSCAGISLAQQTATKTGKHMRRPTASECVL